MTEQPELWAALLPVVDALEAVGADYYVGGSVASSYTGLARATQDADVVADLRIAHALPFIQALREAYYLPEEAILKAIRERGSFNVIHLATAFKVDVFVVPETPFARLALARRVRLEVEEADRALDFCSPEDIVLNKLQWYELGNRVSDRQWYDLQGVLRIQSGSLDLDHLHAWAERLGLADLLEKALAELGPEDDTARS